MRPILALIVLLSAFVSGCSTYPKVVEPAQVLQGKAVTVQVASHGWHTGIILPAELIYARIPELEARFVGVDFLEIGWGDAGFYQANQITSGITFRAIFLPTDSVVHVVGLDEPASLYFSNSLVKPVQVDQANLDSLLSFVSNSFEQNTKGSLIELRKGIYGDSQFYAGEGSYYALNTCNKWTAKALYSAGVDLSPLFKLTASSVMSELD
jgi:uncharacterized protein (TIGR02117 family)